MTVAQELSAHAVVERNSVDSQIAIGLLHEREGDLREAAACFQRALELDPRSRKARRSLAKLLVRARRVPESFGLWYEELQTGAEGVAWIQQEVSEAMRSRDLSIAGEYAAILAQLRWGSRWYPRQKAGRELPLPVEGLDRYITIPKLHHDVEQFEYLQRRGVLGGEFSDVIQEYERLIERLEPRGADVRIPLESEESERIGHVFNRMVHVRHTPRMKRVFSGKWSAAEVEKLYLNSPLGLVVVDDFLTEEALANVRQFCMESTIWFANRYAHGRLGAFFHDGFNCPLLLQIAEELRDSMPRVIGSRYPLRQLWGFKNGHTLPADSTNHADFAAVSVNFWITPEEANLEPTSGGLVVYTVDAPLSWDFKTYNGRADVIKDFLNRRHAGRFRIPYRQNRAIIFNSDLFHATEGLRFRSGYENRRINVTMLYGERQADVHHPSLGGADGVATGVNGASAWRSAAFTRIRKRVA